MKALSCLMALLVFIWSSEIKLLYAAIYTGGSGDGSSLSTGQPYDKSYKLKFSQPPTTTAAGQIIKPAIVVKVLTANNNTPGTCNGNIVGTITLSIHSDPTGGTAALSGTSTSDPAACEATFSNISIDKPGNLYTLKATASTCGSDGSGAGTDTCVQGISESFNITNSDFTVNAELSLTGTTYYVILWLEDGSSNSIVPMTTGNSGITIDIDKSDNTDEFSNFAACDTAGPDADGIYRCSQWTPSDTTDSYSAIVTITYNSVTFSGNFRFNPVELIGGSGGGFDSTDRAMLTNIDSDVDAIKAKTDTVNWTEVDAIRDAVGAGTGNTVFQRVSALQTLVGAASDTGAASTMFGKIANLNDQIAKANWDDIKILSEKRINWTEIADLAGTNVNWNGVKALADQGINWSDMQRMANSRVNWLDLAYMTGSGVNWAETINWDNLASLSNAGVNWNDIQKMSDSNVNWTGMKAMSEGGVNWASINALSKAGVNWSDLQVMSMKGINWSDINVLSKAGVNWNDLNRLTIARINWDDFNVLTRKGVNWDGMTALSRAGVNWADIDVLSKKGTNWDGIKALAVGASTGRT